MGLVVGQWGLSSGNKRKDITKRLYCALISDKRFSKNEWKSDVYARSFSSYSARSMKTLR